MLAVGCWELAVDIATPGPLHFLRLPLVELSNDCKSQEVAGTRGFALLYLYCNVQRIIDVINK